MDNINTSFSFTQYFFVQLCILWTKRENKVALVCERVRGVRGRGLGEREMREMRASRSLERKREERKKRKGNI